MTQPTQPTQPPQPPEGPQRVRITSSRRPTIRPSEHSLRDDIRNQTELGEVYVGGLMRAQLRLALRVILVGVFSLGGLPLLFHLVPATRRASVFGVPFAWLVLGLVVYPTAVLMARQYVRASERLEAEFTAVVTRGEGPGR